MSYEEKVQYLKDNPHIEPIQLSFNECCLSVLLKVKKIDDQYERSV